MKLSDAEWIVMNAVWEKPSSSVRDVLERTQADAEWAYTTVKTLLERLVEKGALRIRQSGRSRLFEPLLSRTEARRSAFRSLLSKAFGGTLGSLVQHLVKDEKLTRRERAELSRLIDELEKDSAP